MANALEAASLVMIPSGYENGTLGSLKPLDGSGDFTFSRGSDISATRVNEDGYIEKGYENLLLQSNTFSDATWVPFTATLTSGQEGYDGSNDAWLLTNTTAGGNLVKLYTFTGLVTTTSVYAKAGSYDWLLLFTGANGAYFDLANGLVGTTFGSQLINTSIQSIGGGWYRCSITQNFNGGSQFRFYPVIADGDISGTSGSIYIQDAMLNQGMVSYPYVETTTAPVAGGILEDMPRLDYTDSSCPALLLEPQRTNLVTQSEYFGDSSWTIGNLTLEANSIVSPEGVQNAYKIENTSSVGNHFIRDTITSTIGSSYALSVFLKKGTKDVVSIADGFNVNVLANFDLTNVTATDVFGTNSSIEAIGNDGWYRCSVNIIPTSTSLGLMLFSGTDYAGKDTSGYFYAYGAQVEQDATYPTSYIPTYGTSQTRLIDDATASNVASLIGQTEGTIFIDVEMNAENGDVINIKPISGSFYANGIGLGNLSQLLRLQVHKPSGTTQVVYPLSVGGRFKFGIRYDTNNLAFFVNGSKFYDNPTTINFSVDLNGVELYGISTTGRKSTKRNNKTLIFPTALSDDECIELTTI